MNISEDYNNWNFYYFTNR